MGRVSHIDDLHTFFSIKATKVLLYETHHSFLRPIIESYTSTMHFRDDNSTLRTRLQTVVLMNRKVRARQHSNLEGVTYTMPYVLLLSKCGNE